MAEFTIRPARPEDTEPAFELFADWQRSSYGEVEIGPAEIGAAHFRMV